MQWLQHLSKRPLCSGGDPREGIGVAARDEWLVASGLESGRERASLHRTMSQVAGGVEVQVDHGQWLRTAAAIAPPHEPANQRVLLLHFAASVEALPRRHVSEAWKQVDSEFAQSKMRAIKHDGQPPRARVARHHKLPAEGRGDPLCGARHCLLDAEGV